jgi:large repetitive protein
MLHATGTFAQTQVSVVGTGAETGISFSFSAPPLNTPGLSTVFAFSSCSVPTGESCSQVSVSASSGVLRLATSAASGLIVRTFGMGCFENDGTYTSLPNPGFAAGVITVSGSTTPQVTTTIGAGTFVAGGPPVKVDANVALSDPASGPLQSAVVTVAGNFQGGEDVLAFSNTDAAAFGNIAASYDAAGGALTLSSAGATATLSQWQSALRTVTFADTAAAPNTATRTLSFVIADGIGPSCSSTRDMIVTGTTPVRLQTFGVD